MAGASTSTGVAASDRTGGKGRRQGCLLLLGLSVHRCRYCRLGGRDTGASPAGGVGSQAVMLLRTPLWPQTLLWPGSQVMCITSSPDPGFSELAGPAAVARGAMTVIAFTVPPAFPPPFASIYPPLDIWICGIFQHPSVLGSRTFGELWTFY